jgi:hypothetical protein
MIDVDRRAVDLCACPTGCVLLLYAEASLLSPEAVAEPVVAVQIAAKAVAKTIFFRRDHDAIIPAALAEGPRLLPFAHAVLEQPAATWWFAPIDRANQEWLGPTGANPPAATGAAEVSSSPTYWDGYFQMPTGGLFTSTGVAAMSPALADLIYDDDYVWQGEPPPYPLRRPDWHRRVPWSDGDAIPAGFGEVSSAVSALLYHSGNYHLGDPPLVRYRVAAAPDLRVYEVDGPRAWHDLCVRYPAAGEDGRLVPGWGTFAQDWDGVHLTLGGLLTADQVRVESDAGWTELALWEFEQTHWLRWGFESIERLPDLTGFLDTPLPLPTPPTLQVPGASTLIMVRKRP